LELPESPKNHEIGMFMVSLQVFSMGGGSLINSTRPGILHYKTDFLRTLTTFAYSIPLLLGFWEEKQLLMIPMFERLEAPFSQVKVLLSSPQIQLYNANLYIAVRLYGVRYLCYNYFFTCFFGGTAFLTGLQFLFILFLLLVYVNRRKEIAEYQERISSPEIPDFIQEDKLTHPTEDIEESLDIQKGKEKVEFDISSDSENEGDITLQEDEEDEEDEEKKDLHKEEKKPEEEKKSEEEKKPEEKKPEEEKKHEDEEHELTKKETQTSELRKRIRSDS